MKLVFWVIIAAVILMAMGLFIRFYDGLILKDVFYANTGRELLRFVYSDSMIIAGLILLILLAFKVWVKQTKWSWLLSPKLLWVLLFAAFVWIRCLYLGQAWNLAGSLGFPLDDAWIHTVYARNFAGTLTIGFIPGVSDAGSSSPLWQVLLAIGMHFNISVVWNSYLCANLCWIGVIIFGYLLAKRLLSDVHWALLFAIILCLQPMLVWNSLAGLETGLFALLFYAAVYFYGRSENLKWMAAVLVGLSGLVRTEGWVLVGVFFLLELLRKKPQFKNALVRLGLSIMIILPWIAHNYLTNGTFLPQTFYAKSYPPSVDMIVDTLKETLVVIFSPGLWVWTLLLPLSIWGWLRHKAGFAQILPLIITTVLVWSAMAVSVGFFWTNHRYMHPFIPAFVLLVLTGFYYCLGGKLILRQWVMAGVVTVTIATGVLSGIIYGYGVKNIEEQQVAMSLWVRDNVPPGEKVAANDVGAMGYFSEHEIYDLNGLVGEGIVWRPFARWDDLLQRGIHWAAIYPEWFPLLSGDTQVKLMASFTLGRTVTVGSNASVILFRE